MKVVKSVSFDTQILKLVQLYMVQHKIANFSQAANLMMKEWLRFKRIAYELQKVDYRDLIYFDPEVESIEIPWIEG